MTAKKFKNGDKVKVEDGCSMARFGVVVGSRPGEEETLYYVSFGRDRNNGGVFLAHEMTAR